MLYLISCQNYIKVGFVKDEYALERRMKSYVCHNPNFELLGVIEGDRKREHLYHKMYEGKEIRNSEFAPFDKDVVVKFLSEPSFKRITLDDCLEMNNIIDKHRDVIDWCYNEGFLNAPIKMKYSKLKLKEISKYIYDKINLNIGQVYTPSEILPSLNEIYQFHKIKGAAKVSDCWDYDKTTKRVDGKIVKAYRIKALRLI